MENKKVVLSVVLVVWVLALIFTFYYLYNVYSDITMPQSAGAKLSSQYVELYTMSPIASDKLIIGGDIEVLQGDVIPVNVKGDDYSIKIFEINNTGNKVDMTVNNFLFFSLKNSESKKLDLNGDNSYDLLITLKGINEEKANVFIKSIDEKKAVGDRLDEALATIKQNSAIQSRLIILISLLFIIILVLYFIKTYLIPTINLKKRTAREKPTSAMNYLLDEFNDAKKSNDNKKAKRIANKAQSLYKHLPESDKKNYKSNIKSMERYLN